MARDPNPAKRCSKVLFLVSARPSCTTMWSVRSCESRSEAMPSTRTKLVLDEQSFQGLLAAAFTIQQHNDRHAAGASPTLAGNQPRPKPAELCRHCGAPLPNGQ